MRGAAALDQNKTRQQFRWERSLEKPSATLATPADDWIANGEWTFAATISDGDDAIAVAKAIISIDAAGDSDSIEIDLTRSDNAEKRRAGGDASLS